MDQFKQIMLKSKPSLDNYIEEMSKWGNMGSLFYESNQKKSQITKSQVQGSTDSTPYTDQKFRAQELDNFLKQVTFINEYKVIDSLDYIILDRLEFQGSLAAKYVQGGIYGRPSSNAKEALRLTTQIIEEVFPFEESKVGVENWDEFYVYKIDGDWCNLTWELCWSYVVNDFNNKRWWLIYFCTDS